MIERPPLERPLLERIAACRVCEAFLPLGPRPVVRASDPRAKILIVGQAPGTKVHASGIPWDDASGKRLRGWLGVEPEAFYDESKFAIVPMGFCYPGRAATSKGRGGDNPPRPECAPLWHEAIRKTLPNIVLTLLVGSYAHAYYLRERHRATLGETVKAWRDYEPSGFIPLVHPSPRNQIWLKRNPWFESEVVPHLRERVTACLT